MYGAYIQGGRKMSRETSGVKCLQAVSACNDSDLMLCWLTHIHTQTDSVSSVIILAQLADRAED